MMTRLLLFAAVAPALALLKPPTNPLLDDARQLLGNAGKFAQKKVATTIEDLAALPAQAAKDARSARLTHAAKSRQKTPDQLSAATCVGGAVSVRGVLVGEKA